MQGQQLQLRDIHLPEAIGWWPPAPGWWILAILVPLFLLFSIVLYKRITRKTAKKTAKKLLLKLKQDTTLDDKHKLQEISALMRRTAISISPRAETASLTGQTWLKFLDSSVNGSPFTEGPGKFLADAHYQKQAVVDLDIPQLITLCEDWLKAQKQN
jgi:hypothetical protein